MKISAEAKKIAIKSADPNVCLESLFPGNTGVTNFSLSALPGFSLYEFRRRGIIASKQLIDRSLLFHHFSVIARFKRPVNCSRYYFDGEFSLDFTLNFWYDEMGWLDIDLALCKDETTNTGEEILWSIATLCKSGSTS